jgi:prepilin-type N-terminal cleavage/methylation domain-containing protein
MTCPETVLRPRGGFTLVEVMIALALGALVLVNVVMVLDTSSKAYEAGTSVNEMEFQADRTLDRIALAIMSSRRESLMIAAETPLMATSLSYHSTLGMEDGEVVEGEPERIEFVIVEGQVRWTENPGLAGERSVIWANWVRDFLEGELPNGVDDNGNGLIDETGLSFDVDGERVNIRLTLERPGPDGKNITRTRETVVVCRN